MYEVTGVARLFLDAVQGAFDVQIMWVTDFVASQDAGADGAESVLRLLKINNNLTISLYDNV